MTFPISIQAFGWMSFVTIFLVCRLLSFRAILCTSYFFSYNFPCPRRKLQGHESLEKFCHFYSPCLPEQMFNLEYKHWGLHICWTFSCIRYNVRKGGQGGAVAPPWNFQQGVSRMDFYCKKTLYILYIYYFETYVSVCPWKMHKNPIFRSRLRRKLRKIAPFPVRGRSERQNQSVNKRETYENV